MTGLIKVLDADFQGCERIRLLLMNRAPKYGNDDDRADGVMREVFESFYGEVNGRPNTKGVCTGSISCRQHAISISAR